MSSTKDFRTKPEPLHRVLREVYRHYLEFKDLVAHTGDHVIEHGYFIYDEDGNIVDKIAVTISFWDLHYGLKELAPRKKEAVFYNVILDMKQKDVSKIMKITMVSVGQYVENAMKQLAKRYFSEGKISYESSNGFTVEIDDPVDLVSVV
jgi:DNA-directed RNA polymerase specialized sigma24 family protein